MKALHHGAAALVLAGLLAGCSSPIKLNEPPVESRTPTPVVASPVDSGATAAAVPGGATAGAAAGGGVATVELPKLGAADAAALAQRVIYFDYDSFAIKDDSKPVVESHAKALVANRSKRITIEGHTDERGGAEYNLALGQKRAESVARAMTLLGVADNQLEAVSFGKERPAVQGSDEAAFAKNRRVELKDR